MKISYIQEYIMLAEHLNFSKVAELCHMTQPGLSRHIAIIEEEMGVKLFDRSSRNITLTSAGQAVLDEFKTMMQSYESAKIKAQMENSAANGVLRISSPYYWTEDFTEPLLIRFEEKHPESTVEIISCQPQDGLNDVLDLKSDIAIHLYIENPDSRLRRVKFDIEPLCAFLPADHRLADRNSIKISEIADEPIVFTSNENMRSEFYKPFVRELLKKYGRTTNIEFETQQIDTLGVTIKKTGGIGIYPYGVRHMDRSYVKAVLLEDQDTAVPMCLYYSTENGNPLIPLFIKSAVGKLSE